MAAQRTGKIVDIANGVRGEQHADTLLVRRILERADAAAFGELVECYQSAIRSFLCRLTREPAVADDLAQECFLRAWDRLASYRATGSLKAWLMQIAYRLFLQWRRGNQRYDQILEQYHRETTITDSKSHGSGGDDDDLERLLAVLSEDERLVMVLSYSYGMSHREISLTTGQPIGTIKSQIHRSKIKIREAFGLQETGNG